MSRKSLVWIAWSLGALTAVSGCAGEDRNASALAAEATSEVEQHANQCGAQRYSGPDTISCSYRGQMNGTNTLAAATCLNFDQVSCKYNFSCDFRVSSVSTKCVADVSSQCWSVAPPEASDPVPPDTFVHELAPGSTLCEPPPGQQPVQRDLDAYCNEFYRARDARWAGDAFCEAVTSYNSGGSVTCCLDCPRPLPPTGGPADCYVRDGGVGADAGPRPDGGVSADAGSPLDAIYDLDAIMDIKLDARH